jgi:hypothetical protein
MESLTERYLVPGPAVYGYVRLPAAQQTRRRALTRALENYCEQHELLLGGVFTDGGEQTLMSPAFAGLLAVLAMNHSYGVVTPARSHLGSRGLGIERTDLIAKTGRRLMVLRDSDTRVDAR